jgi:hypothetical protein
MLASMKKVLLPLCVLIVIWIVGCVPSLNPIWTEKDLIFDPALLGTWRDKDSKATFVFTRTGDKEYRVLQTDENGVKAEFEVRLAKLKDRRFLDFTLKNVEDDEIKLNDWARFSIIPGHLILLVHATESELRIAAMNPDWLKQHVEKNPKAIATRKVGGDGLVLAASTAELQVFVLKYSGEDQLFGGPMRLARQQAAQ